MDARAQEIITREEADAKRLESANNKTAQQVTAVASDVSSVKTDVGGVKTDVAKTQTDLATTISQLMAVKGDLSSTNSVIARNHDELVLLEHKGDRNYYEFTLTKGAEEARRHREPGVEEDRSEEEQVHSQHPGRRQDLREEGQECERAAAVLQRQRPRSV